MGEFVQVVTALGSEGAAQSMAVAVVEARLAACAQVIGPYRDGAGVALHLQE